MVVHSRVWYCQEDEIAVPSPSDVLFCNTCNTMMLEIGWFEAIDLQTLQEGGMNDD